MPCKHTQIFLYLGNATHLRFSLLDIGLSRGMHRHVCAREKQPLLPYPQMTVECVYVSERLANPSPSLESDRKIAGTAYESYSMPTRKRAAMRMCA